MGGKLIVIAQFDRPLSELFPPIIRVLNLAYTADDQGNIACPGCGQMQFTVQYTEPGDIVLSCWHEPTHIRIPISKS